VVLQKKPSMPIPKIFLSILLSFLVSLASSNAYTASFNCKAAAGMVETTICSDSTLSTLDEQLGAVYAQMHKTTTDPR